MHRCRQSGKGHSLFRITMPMKRILFISQHLNRAGTEAFMMNVFRNIDHNRFAVDFLVYNRKDTDYSREVEAAGYKVWRVTSRRESPIKWYRELYAFFSTHAKDYVAIHFNGNGLTAIAPIILAWHYKIPIRITHSHNSSSAGLHNRVFHILQRGLSKHLTTHHFACSSLAAKWFYGSSPAVIIRNGIDTQRFAFSPQIREESRTQLQIQPTTTLVGHVGRFQAEKNHAFLLDIFAKYLEINADALLLLVGNGPLLDASKEKAQVLGIADKVRFLGERPDVNKLLQAMDIFIMPSTFEGQPFVLIEAQCSGLPCQISDVINDDICLTSHVEKMALAQSAEAWAQKASDMLKDYVRTDESQTIEQQGYSIRSTIDYLEKVYNSEA